MFLTIADAAAAIRRGETTAERLTLDAIAVGDTHDREVGIFLARFDDTAISAARAADAELASGIDRGPLHGIPLGIKDIIATLEGSTTAQSVVLDPSWGENREAPTVARLRDAGAVILAKSTTMEFAVGTPDPEKGFPVPRNPWDLQRWSGGSSSGTGAGVALGAFLGGLGTDTGGSIRYPAASCGVTGMKQTFGRVPNTGCVPLAYSLDHIGPMARSAEDCALLLSVLAGHDRSDPCSVDRPVDDYLSGLTGDLLGVRVGLDPLLGVSPLESANLSDLLEAAVAVLGSAGATVVPIELPYYREVSSATNLGLVAEAYAYHRPDLQQRWHDYGAGTRTAVVGGGLISAGDYVQAQRVRRVGQRKLAEIFNEVDVIVTPTTSTGAPPIDGLTLDAVLLPLHTFYWNAVGFPAMSVPMGFDPDGLPMGLQIAGRPFDEAAVLAVGHAYQQRTDWHLRVPPGSRGSEPPERRSRHDVP